MNLIIENPRSKKVKEVQSRFDVGDFKKAEKSENNSDEDDSKPIKLIDYSGELYDKKTTSDEIYVDENGVYQYVVPSLFSLWINKCEQT